MAIEVNPDSLKALDNSVWGELGNLRRNNLYCDVILMSADGCSFPVHSCIMAAASPVLRTALDQVLQMSISLSGLMIEVPAVNSKGLDLLLNIIYHEEVTVLPELSELLSRAAQNLGIDISLQTKCKKKQSMTLQQSKSEISVVPIPCVGPSPSKVEIKPANLVSIRQFRDNYTLEASKCLLEDDNQITFQADIARHFPQLTESWTEDDENVSVAEELVGTMIAPVNTEYQKYEELQGQWNTTDLQAYDHLEGMQKVKQDRSISKPFIKLLPDEAVPVKEPKPGHKRTGPKPSLPAEGCYQCTICKQTYNSRRLVQHHLRRVHRSAHRPFVCTICQFRFKCKAALNKHLERHKKYVHYCGECKRFFRHKKMAEIHKSMHQEQSMCCTKCNRTYTSEHSYRTHMEQHHPELMLNCPSCPFKMVWVAHLVRHQNANHQGNIRCISCTEIFEDGDELQKHLAEVHNIKDQFEPKRYQCDQCEYWTFNGLYMKTHVERKHTRVKKKTFWCLIPGCTFRSYNQRQLTHHQQTVHNNTELEIKTKPYMCVVCGTMFMNQKGVRHHEKAIHGIEVKQFQVTSNGSKNAACIKSDPNFVHKCPYCDQKFISPYAVHLHMATKHERVKRYSCTLCPYTAYFFTNILGHFGRRHKDVNPPNVKDCVIKKTVNPSNPNLMDRKHLCNLCGSSFSTQASLEVHMGFEHDSVKKITVQQKESTSRISEAANVKESLTTDKKGYQCPICKKVFKSSTNLTSHQLTVHENKKRFQCTHCDYVSYYYFLMERHFKQKHPDLPVPKRDETKLSRQQREVVQLAKRSAHVHTCLLCEDFKGTLPELIDHIGSQHKTIDTALRTEVQSMDINQ